MRAPALLAVHVALFDHETGLQTPETHDMECKSISHITEMGDIAVEAVSMRLDREIILTSYTVDHTEENVRLEYRFADNGNLHAVVTAKTTEWKEVPTPKERMEQMRERMVASIMEALGGAGGGVQMVTLDELAGLGEQEEDGVLDGAPDRSRYN